MRKKTVSIACAMLLLTGCGNTANETAAEVPVQEQTAVQESSEMPFKSKEELTAELEEKRASLSEEEFIEYMNTERKAELHLPESAVYNPERDEYYNSNAKEWDSEQHKYIFINKAPEPTDETEPPKKEENETEIPAEMQKALDTFWEKSKQRMEDDSSLVARSDWVFLDDTEHLRALKADTQIPYFAAWAELSKSWGSNNTALAIYMVSDVLRPQGAAIRKDFADKMQEQLTLAADAVNTLGEKITAEDVAALQETYGYMIAPALQDIGKLDLLQIDPDSPCQDAEKLAEFARYFA